MFALPTGAPVQSPHNHRNPPKANVDVDSRPPAFALRCLTERPGCPQPSYRIVLELIGYVKHPNRIPADDYAIIKNAIFCFQRHQV